MAMSFPEDGGCWYCYGVDDELVFSTEFDAYVHLECLECRLQDSPDDREAQIMARELLE